MTREELIRRVQKLLALGGNNPSKHEREQAVEMANKLIEQHSLSMSELQFEESISQTRIAKVTDAKAYEHWKRSVWVALGKLYFVNILSAGRGNLAMIGTVDNMLVTKHLAKWVVESIVEESKEFQFNDHRQSFCIGAATMIQVRVSQLVRKRELESKPKTGSPGTALMVQEKFEAANKKLRDTMNLGVETCNVPNPKDYESYMRGVDFGGQIGLERQIGGDSAKVKRIEGGS